MRKILLVSLTLILFILGFNITSAFAAEYYVSTSGNDKNTGKTSSKPWKTLSKVNSYSFKPGDVIKFKKGESWRGTLNVRSGNSSQYITYTSYGSGKKPAVLGSVNKSSRTDWTMKSENIWVAKMGIKSQNIPDVGNIILNNGQQCGVKVFSESELNDEGDFFYDTQSDVLELYSVINPARAYKSIECALRKDIVILDEKSYVVIDELDIKYGGGCGIFGENTQQMIIRNCDISYIGGGVLYWDSGEPVRYGNGINFWNSNHDNLVEGCNIWQIYDTAITNQGDQAGNDQYNMTYRNNTIWNCEWSFESWNKSETGKLANINFENNNCKDAGYSWAQNQRPDHEGNHICLFANSAQAEEINIRNNVFDNAMYSSIYVSRTWKGLENLKLENNTYYQKESTLFAYWQGSDINFSDFEQYRTDFGKDTGSELILN